MRSGSRLAVAVVVSVLCAVTAAGPAAATWSGPRRVEHRVIGLAGNARGEQAITWTVESRRRVMLADTSWRVRFPQVQLRRADGRWARPQTLTRTRAIVADAGAVGIDGRGAVTAVWAEQRARSVRLMASVRSPGGRFGRGSEIGHVRALVDYDHVLAVAADGAAVILWLDGDRIRVAQRPRGRCSPRAARACFGKPQTLHDFHCAFADECVEYPDLALSVAPGGRAFAMWPAGTPNVAAPPPVLRLAVARPGHRFARAVTLVAPADGATDAQIARVRDGGAVVSWVEAGTYIEGASADRTRVAAMRIGPDGRPRSAATVLSGGPCYGPVARANALDEVTIAWGCNPGVLPDQVRMAATAIGAGAPLVPGVDIGRRSSPEYALGIDRAGNTLLVYGSDRATTVARVRPPGGALGPAVALPASGPPATQPGARLIEAGPRLTLLRRTLDGKTELRDWTP